MTLDSSRDSEWFGEPHTLTVTSVTLPDGQFDDGELEYEIEHPPACKQEEYGPPGHGHMAWTCELGELEAEGGLAGTLRYSGTPVTEPGTYRIGSWGRKYYVHDYGAYEYDAGIALVPDEGAEVAS